MTDSPEFLSPVLSPNQPASGAALTLTDESAMAKMVVRAKPGTPVAARTADVPTDGHVSLVDWTHGRAQFRLTGDLAPSALEKVCGLDWSDAMMPNGAVTSGSVAKVTCDLIRNDVDDTPSYLILCDRSFGQYLYDAITDATTEFATA